MRAAAERRGIHLPSRARQIELGDLSQFDWVITMDHDNLRTVKSLAQEAGSNATAEIRSMLSFARESQLSEVPDPYYGGDQGFEQVLDLLEDACSGLLDALNNDLRR